MISITTGEWEFFFSSRSNAAEYRFCTDRPQGNLETVGRQTSSASKRALGPRVCHSILKSCMHADGKQTVGQGLHVADGHGALLYSI